MNYYYYMYNNVIPTILAGINEAELQKWITGYTNPVMNILIWLIPIAGALASLVTIVIWITKDDELKERERPSRTIKKIIFWCLVGEGIVAIFKALGITSSGL